MVCDVRNFHHGGFSLSHPQGAVSPLHLEDHACYPTLGKPIGQIARVIALCLVLGLPARVLVAVPGVQ
jgi:hypothetical protein